MRETPAAASRLVPGGPRGRAGVVVLGILVVTVLVLLLLPTLGTGSPLHVPVAPDRPPVSALPVRSIAGTHPVPAVAPPSTVWRNWTTDANPGIVSGAGVTYDPTLGGLVLYGGYTNLDGSGVRNSTWEFVGGVWKNLTATAGTPPESVIGIGSDLSYSPQYGGDLLYGGRMGSPYNQYPTTWLLKDGVWENITFTVGEAPGPLAGGASTFDAADGYSLVFGGSPSYSSGVFSNATWSLNATGPWAPVATSTAPAGRVAFGMVYDAASQQVVLFGGRNPSFTDFNDTWVFQAGAWTNLHLSVAPSPRLTPAMIYDQKDQYVVLYGGCGQEPTHGACESLNDTWVFRNDSWTNLTTAPPLAPNPGNVSSFGGAWDPSAGAGIFPGGSRTQVGGTSYLVNSTWAYDWPALSVTLTANRSGVWVPANVTFTPQISGGFVVYQSTFTGVPSGCLAAADRPFTCRITVPGTIAVNLTVSDTANGTNVSQARVTAGPPASVTLRVPAGDAVVGRPFNISTLLTGGTGADGSFTYLGLTGICAPVDAASFACVPQTTGNVTMRVMYADSGGTVTSPGVAFSVVEAPAVALRATLASSGGCTGPWTYAFVATVTGGLAPYAYHWDFGDGTAPVVGNATIQHSYGTGAGRIGTITVRLMVTDADGVSTNQTSGLTVMPPPCAAPAPPSTGGLDVALIVVGIVGVVAVLVVVLALRRRSGPPGREGP